MAGAVAALFSFAACGGGGDRDGSDGQGRDRARTNTTAAMEATMQQVATRVAVNRLQVDRVLGRYRYARTRKNALGQCDSTCRLYLVTLQGTVETMRSELEAMDDDRPDNQLYIGPIPREVAALVGDTVTALEATSAAAEAYLACLDQDATQQSCGLGDLNSSTRRLESELEAWDAFL